MPLLQVAQGMFMGVKSDKAIEFKEQVPMSRQKETLNTMTIAIVGSCSQPSMPGSGSGDSRGSCSTS